MYVCIIRNHNTYGPHMALDDGRVVSNQLAQAFLLRVSSLNFMGIEHKFFPFIVSKLVVRMVVRIHI